MSRLLPPVCAALSLHLLDCSSCALFHALREKRLNVSSTAVAKFASDLLTGAVVVGGAAEVLVPFSLLRTLHDSPGSASAKAPWRAALDTLAKDDRVVVLAAPRDVPRLVERFSQYKKVCMCVPSGPLASRMLFEQSHLEAFYAEELNPAILALSMAEGYRWTSWLRSSLTCRFEGLYVPPIRVAESAARLLASDTGCERVVFEEGVAGLTLRWLETVMKTTSSCGVPLGRVTLALCGNEGRDADLLSRAVDMGIGGLAVSTVPAPLFPHAESLIGVDDVVTFASGWNDVSGQMGAEELVSLEDCVDYCETVRAMWPSWLQRQSAMGVC